jgi:pimeloyl-ACP methyl ester carboxylesterase
MTAGFLQAGRRGLAAAVLGILIAAATTTARAEPVQLKPSLLRLNANLELPPGKTISDGVALILHGTQSHARQETIAALQENLKKRGVSSLAITLSLGIDNREGPRACDVLHDYALAGTRRELALWMAWLRAEGVQAIDLIGFSRGGAQIAAVAPNLTPVKHVVLMAPAFATATEQAEAYQHAFGHPLAQPLDDAKKQPLQKFTVDFLLCKQAPVLGATFLDAYQEFLPQLAAETGHPTLVIVAGKDEVVPDLTKRLPSQVHRVVIDGSGHFFPDLYGEDAADAIAKFLKTE